MVRQLWREGQRVTHEAGDALPHCVGHTRMVLGGPGVLREGVVVCRRPAPGGDRLGIGRAPRLRTVHRRPRRPPRLRPRVTALPALAGKAVPGLGGHGAPHPGLGGLLRHDAPPLLRVSRQTPEAPRLGSPAREPRPRSRPGRTAGEATVPQPSETHAHRPTATREGDGRAASACSHGTLVCIHRAVCGVSDQGAAPRLAWVVWLLGMPMTRWRASRSSPCWAHLVPTPTALWASVVVVGDWSQQYHGCVSRAFPV
jgi:hypothetical protein